MFYKQEIKNKVRNASLSHAIQSLCANREMSCCVPNDYVYKVKEKLINSRNVYGKSAIKLKAEYIHLWEALHQSTVGKKKPSELSVCYLSGPEPENDFNVLVEEGIHPHNIWAFELPGETYNDALKSIKQSAFPMLKLHKGKIENFFIDTPKKFDIVYIDACGPLPSRTQNTLRIISTLFRYQRLSSLSVLITNFACPDVNNAEMFNNYSYLLAHYLYPKSFLESYHNENNKSDHPLTDGAITMGLLAESDKPEESFLDWIKQDFSHYYGQYITRQIFDLSSTITPWIRLANSSYWSNFFLKPAKEISKYFINNVNFYNYLDNNIPFIEPDNHPLLSTFSDFYEYEKNKLDNSNNIMDDEILNSFSKLLPSIRSFRDSYIEELAGFPKMSIGVRESINCRGLLLESKKYYRNGLKQTIDEFKKLYMHHYCDAPSIDIVLSPIFNQLLYPQHYSINPTRRWLYKAKKATMFTDVIVFDECRYIYEWLPTRDLVKEGFLDISQQLSYRFALDGLAKNCRWYNPECFGYVYVVDQSCEDFEAKILKRRVEL